MSRRAITLYVMALSKVQYSGILMARGERGKKRKQNIVTTFRTTGYAVPIQ
jgi:hypothetical protein